MAFIVLLLLGFGCVFLGISIEEEIYRLGSAMAATIFLVWGLIWTPLSLQLVIEIIAVIAVFSVCISWDE